MEENEITRPMLIDATDENYVEEFYTDLERRKKHADIDSFTVDDFCLVRTTNTFPYDKELHILDNTNNPLKISSFLSSTLAAILTKQKYGNNHWDYMIPDPYYDRAEEGKEEEIERLRKIENALEEDFCTITSFGYRTTKHFTLNGLVSSHLYGNFEDRGFIILDPLNKHISDPRLISLGEPDTYFRLEKDKPLVLSDRATLLIGVNQYETFLKDERLKGQLELFNVVLYKGNEKIATDICLSKLGYLSEDIGMWGYEMGCPMDNAVARLQQTHNIPYIQDFYSDHNADDKKVLEKQFNETIRNFNLLFIERFKDKISLTLEELNMLFNYGIPEREHREGRITEIIETIGVNEILAFIAEFNNQEMAKMNNRAYEKEVKTIFQR